MAEMLLKRQPPKEEGGSMEEKKLSEVRDQAYRLCKQYLQGRWTSIPKREFQLTVLGGGLTNKLYICQIPKKDDEKNSDDTPHTVLLRLYGLIIQDFVAQIQESVVFSILSERRIGPHLYAVFPGGRLEEYMPCRTLQTSDLSDAATSQHIAKQMAIYHKLTMPVTKEPTCILDKLKVYFETYECMEFEEKGKKLLLDQLREYNIGKEMKYIQRMVVESGSPVLFCHNDVQEGNLLHVKSETDPVQMIDFEYSGYNYRGFDLGNHFCEWMYNYAHAEWPFYSSKPHNYPSREQQINFIQSYIEEYFSTRTSVSRTDEKWQLDFLMKETERFALLSHIFWALWSVVQAKMSDISFGYMEYALVRMDHYFKLKEKVENGSLTSS